MAEGRIVRHRDALREALRDDMAADENAFLIGETLR